MVKKIREQDESERVAGEPERGSEGVIDVPSGNEDEKKAASPGPSGS